MRTTCNVGSSVSRWCLSASDTAQLLGLGAPSRHSGGVAAVSPHAVPL